jgi:hypothetical protein
MQMKTIQTIACLVLAVSACGDDTKSKNPDAKQNADAPKDGWGPDVMHVAGTPPTLGPQIDRMGRPAVNTALNALLNPVAADVTTQKDNYNHAADSTMWATTILNGSQTVVAEFKANLAVFDVLDQGLATVPGAGCGNQLLYNGTAAGGGAAAATSYDTLAGILADDRLYVDTSKGTCTRYLSLEVDAATAGATAHTDCGGRALSYDVMDFTYSVLTGGVNAFTTDMAKTPIVNDGGGVTRVVAHGDISDTTFPFLGPPTNP